MASSGYFVHISDPHVTFLEKQRWHAELEHILAQSPPPDLVLCTGDLVDFGAGSGSAANYDALLSAPITTDSGDHFIGTGAGRIPIFFCPGNHDYRNIAQSSIGLATYKNKVHANTYFHRIIGNYAIFSVNSGADTLITAPSILPEGTGLFDTTPEQDVTQLVHDLDMLDGVLDNRDASGYKKIIFMHHPHTYPASGQTCSLDGIFIHNSGRLVQACQDFGVGWVLYGHLHPDASMVYDLGCGDWTAGETKCIVAVSASTRGYRREWVDGSGGDVIFEAVPAVSTWGLVAMTVLVMTGGSLILSRRRRANP
jgi:3',5'-cyclic AMP phosphodiesterase CpdA